MDYMPEKGDGKAELSGDFFTNVSLYICLHKSMKEKIILLYLYLVQACL